MPALFNSDKATKGGGARSITAFDGILDEYEDDIKGKYGDQIQYTFIEVDNIESDTEVELEDDVFIFWVPQKTDETSSQMRMIALWEKFATKNKLKGDIPDAIMGLNMRWKKVIFKNEGKGQDGKDMADGKGFVPVKILGKGGKAEDDEDEKPKGRKPTARRGKDEDEDDDTPKRPTRGRKPADDEDGEDEAPKKGKKAKDEEPEISKALMKAALAAMGEDGNTRDSIRSAVIAKAALRTELKALPEGIDALLAHLVETGSASEEDGVYTSEASS